MKKALKVLSAAFLVAWLLGSLVAVRADEADDHLRKLQQLGLKVLKEPMTTYYSAGAKSRATKLARNFAAINEFYEKNLGERLNVSLAVLNSNDWARANSEIPNTPYGEPFNTGRVIVMPSAGGVLFEGFMAGKAAWSTDALEAFAKSKTTFEAVAQKAVDFIGLHEFGHGMVKACWINPRCHWLDELLATYCAVAFTAERPKEWKCLDLLSQGAPPRRPKHTTLADFENLYFRVDDYGWYQTQFAMQAVRVNREMGVGFLKEVRQVFPAATKNEWSMGLPPEEALARLEKIAPGFVKWAEVFREGP
jgi:hypothetical protein